MLSFFLLRIKIFVRSILAIIHRIAERSAYSLNIKNKNGYKFLYWSIFDLFWQARFHQKLLSFFCTASESRFRLNFLQIFQHLPIDLKNLWDCVLLQQSEHFEYSNIFECLEHNVLMLCQAKRCTYHRYDIFNKRR